MERAGARVALHTDDPITDSRHFLRMAGLAVRGGMSPEGALRAVTLEPARMLGLNDRIGHIAPGLDADLVVLTGPPLSAWSQVEQTWVEGEVVFDRSRPADRALAVGGDAVPLEQQ
jgi:imidazolonepropionase-like amidohydrolase